MTASPTTKRWIYHFQITRSTKVLPLKWNEKHLLYITAKTLHQGTKGLNLESFSLLVLFNYDLNLSLFTYDLLARRDAQSGPIRDQDF